MSGDNDNDDGLDETFVYLILALKKDGEPGPVKVGIGSNPQKRLKQLGTGTPFQIGLVGAVMMPTRQIARLIERAFHDVFKEHRMHGEWFDMPPGDAAWGLCAGVREITRAMISDEELQQRIWDSTGVRAFAASVGWTTFPDSMPPLQ